MNNPVQVLYLEDNPRDAELVQDILQQTTIIACELRLARNRVEYEAALAQTRFDLILSDYRLPDYDGMAALALARVKQTDVPFILISGTLGEEQAVDCLLRGATDYVLKQRLNRLVPAVLRALTEAEERRKRREVEAALLESEEKFRRLFESSQDAIMILEPPSWRFTAGNPATVKMFGAKNEAEFISHGAWGLSPERQPDGRASAEKSKDMIETALREGSHFFEWTHRQIAGEEFPADVLLTRMGQGGKVMLQATVRDITERKRAEAYREMNLEILQILNEPGDYQESIQRSLAVLKTRTGSDAVGIRLQDGDDFPYFAQQGFSKDFLLTENTLIGRATDGGVCRDKDGYVNLACTCGLVISGKTNPANLLFTPGGSCWTNDSFLLLDIPPGDDPRLHPRNQCIHQGYASVALVPIRNKDRIIGLIHLNDRHKGRFTLDTVELLEGIASHIGSALMRKRAELALNESNALTDAVVENAPFMVFVKEATDLRFVIFNRAGEELLGYDRKALLGKNNLDLFPPEQAAHFMAKDREVLDGEVGILDILEEPILTAKKGQRLLHTRKVRIRGADGQTKFLLGISEDITERKQAEEEKAKLEDQFRQAQKMESVGRLAGGVAHDFNNLLMGMMNYVELCRGRVEPDHPIQEWLDEIMRDAQRSAEITRQLLAFARKQAIVPRVLDLNDAVAGMLKLLRRLIGEDITLAWLPGADLRSVRLDPSQVDQILANLCVNARDAIAGVGTITLETGSITIDAEFCTRHADAIPGTYACLAVSDDGCGMAPETLAQIFEPFFTTKGIGEGTGLGLATVYGIVKQNNGFIDTYSEPDKGTTFKIYFPQIATEAAEPLGTRTPEVPTGQGETILLVEDEKSIRVPCSLFLDALGYHVLLAETPGDALKMADRHPGDIHLLLTDVVMPGMDGLQLATRLGAARSDLKVLFMSGYTADVMAQRGVQEQGMSFIAKPFMRDDLARKVREVLEGS